MKLHQSNIECPFSENSGRSNVLIYSIFSGRKRPEAVILKQTRIALRIDGRQRPSAGSSLRSPSFIALRWLASNLPAAVRCDPRGRRLSRLSAELQDSARPHAAITYGDRDRR